MSGFAKFVLSLLALGCGGAEESLHVEGPVAAAPSGAFVERQGTGFTLDGKPFAVVGTNTHYLPWGTNAEVDQVLADAVALNLTVVRFFVTSFRGSLDGQTRPTVWDFGKVADSANMGMKGVYTLYWDGGQQRMAFNEGPTGFKKVDYAVAKAGELGLKLEIAFMDFWPSAGGSAQVAAWYGSDWENDRYRWFWTDERAKANYRELVRYVLERKNAYTGVLYKDDPTIFAWNLLNEPELQGVELGQAFFREMGAYVKSIDARHLLATGSEGFYGGRNGSDPESELALPDIDFGTWHSYPDLHGITSGALADLIDQHCDTAEKVGKPVILEEFAYSSSHADQTDTYSLWLDRLAKRNCGGWLFWRLTGIMEDGAYADDNGEHFDIHNDGGPSATVIAQAALAAKAR